MGKNGRKKKGNHSNLDGDEKIYKTKRKKKYMNRSSRHWKKKILDELKDGVINNDEFEFFDG
tara:strand:+ start:301 stop:486 length:186 start_codon:yes stop_codon:yes gene_type:complete